MPARHVDVVGAPAGLLADLATLRHELDVPDDFPADVHAAAVRSAARPPRPARDRTGLELITIDPPGARDLDQALAIEADGDGHVVWYAIADVGGFVSAGGVIDAEARRRGQTLYAPDRRTPLHPPELSEDAASLVAGQDRPACLWRIALDAAGLPIEVGVERAVVRSRAQLSYADAQQLIDDGTAPDTLRLLEQVGRRREQIEIDRGGVSLNLPEQEIDTTGDRWELRYRTPLPVEGWNAQISLLTGIAAARLMLDAGVGILRTLPAAEPAAAHRLRRTAAALHIEWLATTDYPSFVRTLDSRIPTHAAMLNACTTLFRGAGHLSFVDGAPEHATHAALATPYAHCTAPLRRLVDRWASEICCALSAGDPVPEWTLEALPTLPELMSDSDRRARSYERAVIDLTEAHRMLPLLGQQFEGVVVAVDDGRDRGRVVVAEHAVEARIEGARLPLGERIAVRLTTVDTARRLVVFAPV